MSKYRFDKTFVRNEKPGNGTHKKPFTSSFSPYNGLPISVTKKKKHIYSVQALSQLHDNMKNIKIESLNLTYSTVQWITEYTGENVTVFCNVFIGGDVDNVQ